MAKSTAPQSGQKWLPPVVFYFQVCFQRAGGPNFRASFLEVGGLAWDLGKRTYDGNDGPRPVPSGVSYPNVTLKRPVGPLDGSLARWVENCRRFMDTSAKQKDMKKIMAYDVVIHLLDKEGKPQASWQCTNAYPVKWSLGNFDSGDSKVATETVELVYDRLERVN